MEQPFVLIIEDERDVAALLRHVMDMAGYRTEIAMHGKVAIERLSIIQPDIVLLDLNLPGVPGNEILKLIRQDERLKQAKIIVITAYAHIADSLPVEPDLILLKPINIEQFSKLIERFHSTLRNTQTTPIKIDPWDRVTGLYSQVFFEKRIDFALRQSKEIVDYLFAVIVITIDQKGIIKSQLDQERWLSIVRQTASTLKKAVRPTDTVARFNQDQFYVLTEDLPDIDIPKQIVVRIYEKLNEQMAEIGENLRLPIRMGILICDNRYSQVEEILAEAGTALSLANGQEEGFYYSLNAPGLKTNALSGYGS